MPENSVVARGFNILKSEGIGALTSKSAQYALNYYKQSWISYYKSVRQLETAMEKESDSLNGILDTALDVKPGIGHYQLAALQLRDELKELATIVKKNRPKVVMEIGTAQGGTLYIWCRHLDKPSKYVSLDIPGRSFSKHHYNRRRQYFDRFDKKNDTTFVWQNSHLSETRETVREEVLDNSSGIDFLFIDGDHTYEGVKKDFDLYHNLVSEGGIIAFHDIVHHPDEPDVVEERKESTGAEERHLIWAEGHRQCDVDQFWQEIKTEFESREIVSHPDQTWGGIGVIHI